ncbi:MAG: lipid-A-disaccharide synthase [Nitrospinota bacterium]
MKFLIIAGEESGEIYGAALIREIKRLLPEAQFSGIGGDRMAAEGFHINHHCSEMASIGVVHMLKKISFFLGALGEIRARIKQKEYDAVILIDYPDFNLRVAREAFASNVPVFYYVCPQFWAWRRYRVRSVRKWVDTMMVVLPFEEGFYKQRGVNARFIGHPLLDVLDLDVNREELKKTLLPEKSDTLIGLLPGSRKNEVNEMLGRLLETADIIHSAKPNAGFVIPAASHVPMEPVREAVGSRDYIKLLKTRSHDVMAASDFLITKSGTSTLEAAIFGAPMIIVYGSSFFSYWLAKLLVHVKYAGLPNLIAGKEIAPEFFQSDFEPSRVAAAALDFINNPDKLQKARNDMRDIRRKLGERGAAARAAKIIIQRLATLGVKGG